MNNQARLLAASAMMFMIAPLARAESVIEVKSPDDGTVTTAPLKVGTRIAFGPAEFRILNAGDPEMAFAYRQTSAIRFNTNATGIAGVEAQGRLRLLRNPVADVLEVTGHDGSIASVSVTALSGAVVLRTQDWTGEPIDVASLAPGLYILNINKQQLKFIKK